MKNKKEPKEESNKKVERNFLVVVRVRGKVNLKDEVKKTLENLNLHNKNWCTIFPDSPSVRGMLNKVKDYVTWGMANEDLIKKIVEKKGELAKNSKNYFEFKGKKYKRYFRLMPPRKGYGRKGIKKPFSVGGALGYRGEKIYDLIERML